MKCSKLLLGLALACGITAANADEIQGTSCQLGTTCTFQSNGSIVHFSIDEDENSDTQEFFCDLKNVTGDTRNNRAAAKVYLGKDAKFNNSSRMVKISIGNPANLSISVSEDINKDGDIKGEIKVRLEQDRSFDPGSVGVTCDHLPKKNTQSKKR